MSDKLLIENAAQAGVEEGSVSSPLTRADWLEAAINIFVKEGVSAVRITRLAEILSVTRGSFYWHFKDRDDLLSGITAFWAQKNARSVITATLNVATLDEGMLALFSCWLNPARFDPGLDMAMRDWARRSGVVQAEVRQADRQCIAAIADFFQRMGVEPIEANTRSRTTYFCQLGYYALGLDESLEQRLTYLEPTIYMLSGRHLDPELAAQFRANYK
ncbi:MAG: TetR/AcrR family transcriptional regulator [Burkholderiaceae bacterium]|nr:TetR/AcrR family transcriptional regulator [Burkholderiaceae bacterium]